MSKNKSENPNKEVAVLDKNEKYRRFLQWYVTTPKERRANNSPLDLSEYCQKTKTTTDEIVAYQEKSSFVGDVTKEAISWGKSKSREILQWAYQIVSEKKTMENMEKFFDLINKVEEKYKQDNPANNLQAQNVNFFNVNEKQYEQIIGRESRIIEGGSQEEAA